MELTDEKFDVTSDFKTTMRTQAQGMTLVHVTWPSDELWTKRAKARRVLTRLLGRGQQEVDVEPGDSDLDIYKHIRCEDSPDLTAAEATKLMNVVAHTRVANVELGESEAVVSMEVVQRFEVTHRLKIPSAEQQKDCTKAMDRFVGMPHNVFSNTINLSVTGRLWDALKIETENYEGAVPIIHKDAAIREMLQALDRETAEGSDEKGF
jgi:hypothetical protein